MPELSKQQENYSKMTMGILSVYIDMMQWSRHTSAETFGHCMFTEMQTFFMHDLPFQTEDQFLLQ